MSLQQPLSNARSGAARPASISGAVAAEARTAIAADVFRLPFTLLLPALGVLLVALADSFSRTTRAGAAPLFWMGILLVFVPIAIWQARPTVERTARVLHLLVLGVAFYLVKVIRDPFGFTYADELVHQYNAQLIVRTGKLFAHNPILPVTPSYPGLESVTAAVASITGLSTFVAGLIVIGFARIVLMLALFLLYEQVSGSARTAGLAATLYAISPHYLFFTAQFSYESLALPLLVVTLAGVARAWPADGRGLAPWAAIATAAMIGVVITHHMTSYALVAFLAAVCLVPLSLRGRNPRARRPWAFALGAAVATLAWLTLVASQTVGYLSPVLTKALTATFRTASGEAPSRQLFHSSTGQQGPSWEHLAALGSTLVVVLAIPLGLRAAWRSRHADPLAVVLGVMSLAYVGSLLLRLVPAAWETAVRASEFLFIGVALALAEAVIWAAGRVRPSAMTVTIGGVLAAFVVIGGVVSGSSSAGRLAQPYRIDVGGHTFDPPAAAVARWAVLTLGRGQRMAAEEADARLLLVYGGEHVFAGTNPPIKSVLQTPTLYRWQLNVLRRNRIRYVVIDARLASGDVSSGYFFTRGDPAAQPRLSPRTLTKFERAGARRIYDNGDIFVDDLRGVRYAAAAP